MKKLSSQKDHQQGRESLPITMPQTPESTDTLVLETDEDAGSPAAWFPIGLTAEERADPLQVAAAFFRTYPLPEAQERISRWREAVLSEPSWPLAETGMYLEFYVSVCRLALCASLLQRYETPLWALHILEGNDGGASEPPAVLYLPRGAEEAALYYPRHLDRSEWSAPGLVLRRLFKVRSAQDWLSELYELLTYSLSDCTPDLVEDECDVAGIMEGLLRMTEAVHLMCVWDRLKRLKRERLSGSPKFVRSKVWEVSGNN